MINRRCLQINQDWNLESVYTVRVLCELCAAITYKSNAKLQIDEDEANLRWAKQMMQMALSEHATFWSFSYPRVLKYFNSSNKTK